jgi:predicted ATP-grasp superfamily ATP-dependent carboligase
MTTAVIDSARRATTRLETWRPAATDPPVILLGGGANALSVARCLGRAGIKVYALNVPTEYVRYSRYCEWIPALPQGDLEQTWESYLLGPTANHLRGAVLLSCSDPGIQLIARHRDELARRFVLDDSNPQAQLCMLNKLCTYRQAVAAGVPTPRFWVARTLEEVRGLRDQLVYPLLVKPQLSHLFEQRFKKKFSVAQNFDQLALAYAAVSKAGIETMLVEMIPGPDDRSCSYYTYLDENSEPVFHFTKRIFRRYPTNMGGACAHNTEWIPEVRDVAVKLLRHVRLRGLAHVEFKRDHRDGRLKLIECNARFTAANCQVAASGFDLARFVYNRLTGRPQPCFDKYQLGLLLWDPVPDYHAFRELQARGQLTFWQWLRSIARPQMLTFFAWDDPWPTLVKESRRLKEALGNRLRNVFQKLLGWAPRQSN